MTTGKVIFFFFFLSLFFLSIYLSILPSPVLSLVVALEWLFSSIYLSQHGNRIWALHGGQAAEVARAISRRCSCALFGIRCRLLNNLVFFFLPQWVQVQPEEIKSNIFEGVVVWVNGRTVCSCWLNSTSGGLFKRSCHCLVVGRPDPSSLRTSSAPLSARWARRVCPDVTSHPYCRFDTPHNQDKTIPTLQVRHRPC